MPPDPKGKRREMHILSQKIPFRICMHEKKIDMMSQILQQNNLGDCILEYANKKKPEDLNSKKDNSSNSAFFAYERRQI